jgi:Tol biopolymer transport system component
VIGVPLWSPAGDRIVFILTRQGHTGEWLVNPDGSGLHQLVPRGSAASWSGDGRWLYYVVLQKDSCIEKIPVDGGMPVRVQCGYNLVSSGFAGDGSTFYFANAFKGATRGWEIRKARPENGPFQVVGRLSAARIPVNPNLWQQVPSPDGKWLAAPLLDGDTSNLWVMPADGGAMRQLTDFGQRSTIIARRVSWSPDGKSLYAAVAETDADIVLLDGLLP